MAKPKLKHTDMNIWLTQLEQSCGVPIIVTILVKDSTIYFVKAENQHSYETEEEDEEPLVPMSELLDKDKQKRSMYLG